MAPLPSSRYPGRNGKLLVGLTTTAQASAISYVATFKLSNDPQLLDATAFGDGNHIKFPDLPDPSASYTGFGDIAGDALYTAARDGLDRRTYWYPDYVNAVGTYFFFRAFFGVSNEWGVGDMAKITGNVGLSSDLNRVLTT